MAGETQITVCGNAVSEPELRYTPTGIPVAKVRIASTPRYRDSATGEFKDGDSLFLDVSVWRKQAEFVAESVTRGMRLVVVGALKQRSYEASDGSKRTVFEVQAEDIAISLRNGSAKFTKAERSGGSQPQRGPGAEDPWASDAAPAGGDSEPPF